MFFQWWIPGLPAPNYRPPWIALQRTTSSSIPTSSYIGQFCCYNKNKTKWFIATKLPSLCMPHVAADGNRLLTRNPVPCVFLPDPTWRNSLPVGQALLLTKDKEPESWTEQGLAFQALLKSAHITSTPVSITKASHVAKPDMRQKVQSSKGKHWKSYGVHLHMVGGASSFHWEKRANNYKQ